jgi:hypothetical protein
VFNQHTACVFHQALSSYISCDASAVVALQYVSVRPLYSDAHACARHSFDSMKLAVYAGTTAGWLHMQQCPQHSYMYDVQGTSNNVHAAHRHPVIRAMRCVQEPDQYQPKRGAGACLTCAGACKSCTDPSPQQCRVLPPSFAVNQLFTLVCD